MTSEQQRITIAEWMGYNPTGMERDSAYWTLIPLAQYSKFDEQDKIKHRTCVLPNYPSDLNAMHEAEKKIYGTETWLKYEANLYLLNNSPIAASADEKSESLCRTLWPERWVK